MGWKREDGAARERLLGLSPEAVAGTLLRLGLGMLFFFAGVGKLFGPAGPAGFAAYIMADFSETWLPRFALIPYAYTLPYIETVLGAVLILGILSKTSLAVCGLLLISLAFGKVLQGDHATVANNLNYVLMTAVAYWCTARDNPLSVDRFHEEALGAVAVGGKPPLRGPVARETVTTRRDGSA